MRFLLLLDFYTPQETPARAPKNWLKFTLFVQFDASGKKHGPKKLCRQAIKYVQRVEMEE